MPTITFHCEACKKSTAVEVSLTDRLSCPACGKSWLIALTQDFLQSCPLCQCKQFYVQKDFNRALGCLIMLMAIVLVPFTYGLSLPVFFLFDWRLRKKVHDVIICYRCGAEFRGFVIPSQLKEFMHHIGEKYEREKEKIK